MTDHGDALVGTMLGKDYRVIEPIGAGGMAVVYLVEHQTLLKRFAAKVLSEALASSMAARARFAEEAHAASQLDHENIVSISDFGVTPDHRPFFVMELLRGQPLDQRLADQPMALEEVVAVAVPVARALAHAHAEGIVHLDVKPENIFLVQRSQGRWGVKVVDFGIAKTPLAPRPAQPGETAGSPMFMAPEVCRGDDDIDQRADVYSFGILLYLMLCGRLPFVDDAPHRVLEMQLAERPAPPREVNAALSPELSAVIERALAKDPDDRYPSMEALLLELEAALPAGADRLLIAAQSGSAAADTPFAATMAIGRQDTARAGRASQPPPVAARTSQPPVAAPPSVTSRAAPPPPTRAAPPPVAARARSMPAASPDPLASPATRSGAPSVAAPGSARRPIAIGAAVVAALLATAAGRHMTGRSSREATAGTTETITEARLSSGATHGKATIAGNAADEEISGGDPSGHAVLATGEPGRAPGARATDPAAHDPAGAAITGVPSARDPVAAAAGQPGQPGQPGATDPAVTATAAATATQPGKQPNEPATSPRRGAQTSQIASAATVASAGGPGAAGRDAAAANGRGRATTGTTAGNSATGANNASATGANTASATGANTASTTGANTASATGANNASTTGAPTGSAIGINPGATPGAPDPGAAPDTASPPPAEAPAPEPHPEPHNPPAATPPPVAAPPTTTGSLDAVPAVTELDVKGSLSRAVVRRSLERALPALRACYRTAAHADGSTPAVELTLTFEIDENSLATQVNARTSTLTAIAGCAAGVTRQIRTPEAPDTGTAQVTAVIRFQPS